MTGNYPFDDTWARERDRLGSLATPLDPGTRRLLAAVGVGPGWRCLEVGAGDGSVAAWLCEQVGPTGRVVAALRPGGWLIVEEPDMATLVESAEPAVFRKVVTAAMGWLEDTTGVDARCGRRLLAELSTQDLSDVDAEGRLHMMRGADPGSARRGSRAPSRRSAPAWSTRGWSPTRRSTTSSGCWTTRGSARCSR